MDFPEAFIKETEKLLGEETPILLEALRSSSPTSIRVNSKIELKPSNDRVAWCKSGYYLHERPLFTADPLLHAGAYYVQEAGSMFLEQIVHQHFPYAQTVLDLCAAPGGKSTLLAQTLNDTCVLVSNEVIKSRANILLENLTKWGNSNIVITNNEPKDFEKIPGFFDAIVVDAPCSGEGMFRKDPNAILEWSEYNVKVCVERQREIVSSVWDALKEDGVLVYSTCTFNQKENEENIEWFCNEFDAEILRINITGFEGIVSTKFGYRFYPHKTKSEGFFISIFKKNTARNRAYRLKKSKENFNYKLSNLSDIKGISLISPESWNIIRDNNLIYAIDKERFTDFLILKKELKCLSLGICLGEFKGKDFIPSENIALSKKIDKNSVYCVEADYETAIKYLRKDNFDIDESRLGYFLICYKGLGLGWVKNLGNRCNNLYPNHWKIRMKI